MSCKAAIYTVNSGTQAVALNGTISLGSIIRRFGCGINLNGNGITIDEGGYFDVDATITVSPTAAGTVTVQMLKDGVAVPGATVSGTAAAAGDFVNIPIDALVRECCPCTGSTLTFVLTAGAGEITNIAVKVEKI